MERLRMYKFTTSVWNWYRTHKRLLPWRDLTVSDDTQRAYMILVSEMMLQQTQVSRVIPAFQRFLEQFPTISDLARAGNSDVIRAWQGMGYNMRALRLRDAARTIVEKYHGEFPKDYDDLISIKGIGPYTAGAIRNFAFDLPTACADTNIERIISRVFIGKSTTAKQLMSKTDGALRIALETNNSTRDWHAALMDLGALVCKKTSPSCAACPLNQICKSAFKVRIEKKVQKREPGRLLHGKYIPNRIFRGKIVEALRTNRQGLLFNDLGRNIATDWSSAEHKEWLDQLIHSLKKDELIRSSGKRLMLFE